MEKLSSPAESMALWREALALDPATPGALDALEKLTEREKDWPASRRSSNGAASR